MNKEAAGREAGCFFWEERRGAHIAKPLDIELLMNALHKFLQ